jgi:tetratricopeptide (TPR) repeat protein/two-component sensor histidine kinase
VRQAIEYSRIAATAVLLAQLLLPTHAGARKQGQALIDSLKGCLSQAAKEDTNKASLLSSLSFALRNTAADEGIAYSTQSLTLTRQLGWKQGEAWALNAVAVNYEAKSNYPKALEYLFADLKIEEDLGDASAFSVVSGNIGGVYLLTGNSSKALDYYNKALPAARAAGDQRSEMNILGGIGNTYDRMGNYPAAIRYIDSAVGVARAISDYENVARNLGNLADGYCNEKDFSKAIAVSFQALDIASRYGFKTLYAVTLGNIGETYLSLAKESSSPPDPAALRKAVSYLDSSIATCKAIGYLAPMSEFSERLTEAYKRSGNYEAALATYANAVRYKDSVFSLESKVKIANLETKREVELKDKQIEIDRLEVAKKRNERAFFIAGIALLLGITAFVFRNIRLKSAKELSENKLQAFQARMNPHFIFNSLNSIQSLVLNSETVPAITYLSRFSKLMRQILDSSAKSKVVLQTELDMLRGYIELEQLRFDAFRYELNVAPDIAAESTEVPAMIIQPFVENAIIHGILPKKADGVLKVSFSKEEGRIICTIDDNGIGRKASAALNAERRKDHESHGISIASNRLALLSKNAKGGVMYIDKEDGGGAKGTTVILQIPIL